ncbi:MAG: hypothetical protein KDC38_16885, partial [Planctomycetes bacterium]|nr:hypothetical protein [Planctomycetota bacterium]
RSEGGALFVSLPASHEPPLAHLSHLEFGRPAMIETWLRHRWERATRGRRIDRVRCGGTNVGLATVVANATGNDAVDGYEAETGCHPSAVAVAVAIAARDARDQGTSTALITESRFADISLLIVTP